MATNMKVDKPLQKETTDDQKHLKRKMEEEKAYAEFQNKVKRTILLDNLSSAVTSQIIKTSLAQCGNVINVQFIPNYTIPDDIPQAALVEMETPKQAQSLVDQIRNCPFMICEMPRPVRATLAKESNFADRPRRPGRKISYRWLKPGDADFEIAKKLQNLTKKHNAESTALLKYQLKEEGSIAAQHEDMLKTNWEKIETIEKVTGNNGVYKLANLYKMDLPGF